MTLGKFVWTVANSALWFSRADELGDPYEASWLPYANRAETIPEVLKSNWERVRPFDIATTAVNCWHMNEDESAGMWSIYCHDGEGVAIQSTFAKLAESLTDCPHFASVGLVHYIDYRADHFHGQDNNGFQAFLHKRKSYAHEKEVRAIVWPPGGSRSNVITSIDKGLPVTIPLRTLAERIFVAPTAPKWFPQVVQAIARKFGLTCEIIVSDLHSRPML